LDYAQQTVTQSQDRFSAGVTNNVEVIQAQQQLASANDQYITSLYAHNIAKVLLARAVGNAEQVVKQYFAEPGGVTPPTSPHTPQPNPSAPQPKSPSAELRAQPGQFRSSIRVIDSNSGTTAFRPATPPATASRENISASAVPQQ
jgi:hypothetical protein